MIDIAHYVPPLVIEKLSIQEKSYLAEIFCRFDGYPSIEQLWQLVDEPWRDLNCDPLQVDDRVSQFYQHPVWILNGLFVEQDKQSLQNRQDFTSWVVQQQPQRIADFGGGFGGLARFIAASLPSACVEIVEPHPHQAAIALAANTPNVRFVSKLSAEYDLLIATDVFEHVPDPIGLAAETVSCLRIGGKYLIANCFQPVVLCHLPQLFHLHYAWEDVMQAMGLEPGDSVVYGRAYCRTGEIDIAAARQIGERARKLYQRVTHIPIPKVRELLLRKFLRTS